MAAIQLAAGRLNEGHVRVARESLLRTPANQRHIEWGFLVNEAWRVPASHPVEEARIVLPSATQASAWHKATVAVTAQRRLADTPHSMRFSADGTRLDVFSPGSYIALDTRDLGVLAQHTQPHSHVLDAAPDGTLLLLVVQETGRLVVAHASGGHEERVLRDAGPKVERGRLLPEQELAITIDRDAHLRVWSLTSAALLHEAPTFDDNYGARLHLSQARDEVWVLGVLGSLQRFSLPEAEPLPLPDWELPGVNPRAIDAPIERVLFNSVDGTLSVAHAQTGANLRTLTPAGGRVLNAQALLAHDGSFILAMGGDDRLTWYRAADGTVLADYAHGDFVSSYFWEAPIALSPAGDRIALADASGGLSLLAPFDPAPAMPDTLEGFSEFVIGADYAPDGSTLVTADYTGHLRRWDQATGELLDLVRPHEAPLMYVRHDPTGQWLLSYAWDQTAVITDAETLEPHTRIALGGPPPAWEGGPISGVNTIMTGRTAENRFSPDGQRVVLPHGPNRAAVYDVRTGNRVATLDAEHENWVYGAEWSPRGDTILAYARHNHLLTVHDAATGAERFRIPHRVYHARYAPDGSRIITAQYDEDTAAEIWEVDTGQRVHRLRAGAHAVEMVAFGPQGARAYAVGWDHRLRVWDAHTGELLHMGTAHGDEVTYLAVSPDGERLLTFGNDWRAILWNKQAQPLVTLPQPSYHLAAAWHPGAGQVAVVRPRIPEFPRQPVYRFSAQPEDTRAQYVWHREAPPQQKTIRVQEADVPAVMALLDLCESAGRHQVLPAYGLGVRWCSQAGPAVLEEVVQRGENEALAEFLRSLIDGGVLIALDGQPVTSYQDLSRAAAAALQRWNGPGQTGQLEARYLTAKGHSITRLSREPGDR